MNQEPPDIKACFRKGRGTRNQIANICWIIENTREFHKKSTAASLTMLKPLGGSQQTVGNFSRDRNTRPPYLSPEKTMWVKKATVRTRHGTTDWFKVGKGVQHGCISSPCLFNLFAEYIM